MSASFSKTKANARGLLAAAKSLDLPVTVVESTRFGFEVPDEVAEAFEKAQIEAEEGSTNPDQETSGKTENTDVVPEDEATRGTDGIQELSEAPFDPNGTNDEIKAYAEAHEIDLGDATKKADMVAVIEAALKEKE